MGGRFQSVIILIVRHFGDPGLLFPVNGLIGETNDTFARRLIRARWRNGCIVSTESLRSGRRGGIPAYL